MEGQNRVEAFNSDFFRGLSCQFKFRFIWQKLFMKCCLNYHIELFWLEFKVNSKKVVITEKGLNYRMLCTVFRRKMPSSSSFLAGGTPLSLNWLWNQLKKDQCNGNLSSYSKFSWMELFEPILSLNPVIEPNWKYQLSLPTGRHKKCFGCDTTWGFECSPGGLCGRRRHCAAPGQWWLGWAGSQGERGDVRSPQNCALQPLDGDQVFPLPQFFSVYFFVYKIIDLPGGQINDPSSGKYFSLPFLPATPSSSTWTLQRFLSINGTVYGPSTHLVRCSWNYKEPRILSGALR